MPSSAELGVGPMGRTTPLSGMLNVFMFVNGFFFNFVGLALDLCGENVGPQENGQVMVDD